jgi:hypothetical protein
VSPREAFASEAEEDSPKRLPIVEPLLEEAAVTPNSDPAPTFASEELAAAPNNELLENDGALPARPNKSPPLLLGVAPNKCPASALLEEPPNKLAAAGGAAVPPLEAPNSAAPTGAAAPLPELVASPPNKPAVPEVVASFVAVAPKRLDEDVALVPAVPPPNSGNEAALPVDATPNRLVPAGAELLVALAPKSDVEVPAPVAGAPKMLPAAAPPNKLDAAAAPVELVVGAPKILDAEAPAEPAAGAPKMLPVAAAPNKLILNQSLNHCVSCKSRAPNMLT